MNRFVPIDKLIEKLNIRDGVFIEVGANDGIIQSNTLLLERCYGWTGILVEPSENVYLQLCANRPNSKCFQCALGSFDENNTYVYGDFDGSAMSSIEGKRLNRSLNKRVLMRSLQSILDEENLHHINFFSLDVEGYEYNILRGIDFSKTIFDYLLIEIYNFDYEQICNFLLEQGYDMVELFSLYDETMSDWDGTHNDYLFKRRDL